MIKIFFNKLSVQISIVIIIFGIIGASVFSLFYTARERFFEFTLNSTLINENTANYAAKLENKLLDENVSINDVDKIEKILGKSAIYSVNIYLKGTDIAITGTYPTMLDNLIIGYTVLDTEAFFKDDGYNLEIELKDGIIEMQVYSFAAINLIIPYFVSAIICSFSTFLIPIFIFIRRKVHYIETLKTSVTYMAQGDLEHQVIINSYDEIGELSKQIDLLRTTLKHNFKTEEHNRKANYDLVTALSHDLRTPLTSLMGYLDIVRLKKYHNNQQYELFLNKSIDKVNQINELANKMFEYFLVFSKEQETPLTRISLGVIYEYVLENIDGLEEHGFLVELKIDKIEYFILGNLNYIKRIINNIFSNLLKYANINEPINIKMTSDDNNLILIFKNAKINSTNYIESNEIGLKSVQQMIKIHHGTLEIINDKLIFILTITIPLIK